MRPVVVDALLVVAVVVQAGSCLGVLVMRDAYSRLHYAAAATTVGPIAVAAAVVVEEALSEQGVKAVLTAAVLLTGGALLTHATGRAARVREHGRFAVLADEREKPR